MNKQILKLAGPSILANITVPLVGMADLAIAGRLGDAASIGGIAIATMLFDLLYWNMGFLRVGTGGLAAQAYGRNDYEESAKILVRALGTALSAALIIWLIQYFFLEASFFFIDCSTEVEELARVYFNIRIWAAPATLSLFAFKGWFIGMQNTVFPMITDVSVNVLNLVISILLAVTFKMGITGIALGTLLAQYLGLSIAIFLFLAKYKSYLSMINIKESLNLKVMKSFFVLNGNLFIRSICLLLVYTGFTSISAKYGDNLLAVNTIMMKLMLLFSYFIDGFAYAGEALTGRFIGAKDKVSLVKTINNLFLWCLVISVVSTGMYWFFGDSLFALMTDNPAVLSKAPEFLPWLLIMPVVSCVAFTWDGIFIGATASKAIRDVMILSSISFFLAYYLFENYYGINALWIGYIAHLIVRTIMMTMTSKTHVLAKVSVSN